MGLITFTREHFIIPHPSSNRRFALVINMLDLPLFHHLGLKTRLGERGLCHVGIPSLLVKIVEVSTENWSGFC